jgi:hypothetical protein
MREIATAHSVVFHRIFWGIVMLIEVTSYMEHDYAKAYSQLVEPKYLFHYYGFDW